MEIDLTLKMSCLAEVSRSKHHQALNIFRRKIFDLVAELFPYPDNAHETQVIVSAHLLPCLLQGREVTTARWLTSGGLEIF